MTEETMELVIRPHIRRMRKKLIGIAKKDTLTQQQIEKKIHRITAEAANQICEDINESMLREVLDPELDLNETIENPNVENSKVKESSQIQTDIISKAQVDLEKQENKVMTKVVTSEEVECAGECAIEVSNLCIDYKTMSSYSIKKMLLHGKKSTKEVFRAVKGVSFSIEKGEIWGIIGKNGSGKSTMLRAIAGIFSPDSGTIDLKGNSISLLSIGVGFKKELTGRENIVLSGMLLGFSEQYVKERMEEIIEFSELGDFIDRPVRTYSSGMYSKLAFSITSSLETDIILIDEVLSVGDEKFRKKSMNKMKELISDRDRTVVIVSHSISTLNMLCDKVLWLHEGEIKMLGPTKEVLKAYKEFMK